MAVAAVLVVIVAAVLMIGSDWVDYKRKQAVADARNEGFREGVASERERILKLVAPKPHSMRRLIAEHAFKDADDEYL